MFVLLSVEDITSDSIKQNESTWDSTCEAIEQAQQNWLDSTREDSINARQYNNARFILTDIMNTFYFTATKDSCLSQD